MIKLISTVFYIGYLPLMPGTWASLAGCLAYFLLRNNFFIFFWFLLFFIPLGVFAAGEQEKLSGRKDPKEVVVDELAGQMLTFLFLPFSINTMVLGFFLFRFFDIVKLPFVRRLEKIPGGWGIMSDDMAAAVLSNIVLQIFRFIWK